MSDAVPDARFEALLGHTRWMQGLARALVGDGRAEDAVQATWVAALEHPPGQVRNARRWLAGVLRNVVRQEARSEGRRRAREARRPPPEPQASAAEVVARAELHERVVRAVLDLGEPHRAVLLMRYFDGLPAEEIARRLELPASTVRSRLQAALEQVRQRLDRECGGDRRAWSLALTGIARLPIPAPAAPAAPTASLPTLSTASTGALTMVIKSVIAVVAVLGAGLGATYTFRQFRSEPASAPGPVEALAATLPATPESTASQPAEPQEQEGRRPLDTEAQAPGKPVLLRGRVLDAAGMFLANAPVFVGGRPSPFDRATAGIRLVSSAEEGEEQRPVRGEPGEVYREIRIEELAEWLGLPAERLEAHGGILGRELRTDEQGRFQVELRSAAGRVYVTVLDEVGLHPLRTGSWHGTSEKGPIEIELFARRVPTSRLSIRVVDLTTREPLPRFGGSLWRGERQIARWEPLASVAEQTVELPGDRAEVLRVVVESPAWARTTRELQPVPGTFPVEIQVESGQGFHGQVLDERGNPVEGATVFWGELVDLRGDSLFRRYDVARAVGAVRSDVLGSFTLPGQASWVSAWHAELSPASAPLAEAATLTLPPRGAIRGTMTDAAGAPLAGARVELDDALVATTNAAGAFLFPEVEAGIHGLDLGERRFAGVRVAPGETVEVDPGEGVERLRRPVTSGGSPFHPRATGGVVIGLARTFSVAEWEIEGGELHTGPLRPGRHLFLGRRGLVTLVDVVPGDAGPIELGSATVTLQLGAHELPPVYLLPVEVEDDLAASYWAERTFGERETPEVRFGPLAAGRYAVVVHGRGVVSRLDLVEGQSLELLPEDWLEPGPPR